MDTDLDVLRVRRLQLLSEVRVRLQNLDHLPEVPVVVQAGVLQDRVVKKRESYSQQAESQKLKRVTETFETVTTFSSGNSALASWLSALRSMGTDQTPAAMERSSSQPGERFILLQDKQRALISVKS